VGTPADLSASLPQGAHTAQSRVGRDLVAGRSVRAAHWHAACSSPAATRVSRNVDLLKGRDTGRMSIGYAQCPGSRLHRESSEYAS
jgi:hypothetical protein